MENKEELQFISCMCQVSIGDTVLNSQTKNRMVIETIDDEAALAQKRANGESWYLVK